MPSPQRPLLGSALVILTGLALMGCSSPAPPPGSPLGQWTDNQKDEAFISFLDHEICAEVSKSPMNVVVYRWSQQGAQINLEPVSRNWARGLKPPARQSLSLKPDKEGARLVSEDGRIRKLRKANSPKVDPALVGVWRNQRRWTVYSPEGEAISLLYSPPQKGSKIPSGYYGEWFQVQVAAGRVRFEGYSPLADRRGFKIPYQVAGNTLTLKFVPKPGVWQKAARVEWGELKP